jgi:hypothetical protein
MRSPFTGRKVLDLGLIALFVANFAAIVMSGADPRIREAVCTATRISCFTSAYADAWNKVIMT